MASTRTWLAEAPGGRAAIVATIEGISCALAACEGELGATSVWTGLRSMYQADGYATLLGGLHVVGAVAQRLEPFEPTVTQSSVELVYTDVDGILTMLLLGGRASLETYATEQVDATQTSIAVLGTADWGDSGELYLGRETATYDAKSGAPDPSFDTLTRGAYSDGRTSGGDRLGRARRYNIDGDASGVGLSPRITDYPAVKTGRIVSIYVHHLDGTGGAFVPIADRACIFRGYLSQLTRQGRELRFSLDPLAKVLDQQLLAEQFIGEPSGAIVLGQSADVGVAFWDGAAAAYAATATVPAGTYADVHALAQAINLALQSLSVTSGALVTSHLWTFQLLSSSTGGASPVVEAGQVELTTSNASAFRYDAVAIFKASPRLTDVMGWPGTDTVQLERAASDLMTAKSPAAPVRWAVSLDCDGIGDGTLVLRTARGTWIDQPRTLDNTTWAIGFLKLGDLILSVKAASYSSGEWTFTVGSFLRSDGQWRGVLDLTPEEARSQARWGEDVRPPSFVQVWYEDGTVGDLLLRCLVSTGVATTNHATYDDRHSSMSAELPWNFVEPAGFLGMTSRAVLQIEKPQTVKSAFAKLLAACGYYVLAVDGQLKLRRIPWETALGAARAITLADLHGKKVPEQTWGALAPINRISVKAGMPPILPALEVAINDLVSRADNGPAPGPAFEAAGLRDLEEWARQVAAPTMAYWARGAQQITLETGWPLCQLVPCDRVTLTHPAIFDPETASEGVTDLAAWVIASGFDFGAGHGEATLVLLDQQAQRQAYWAPAARLAAYSVGPPTTVTVAARTYALASDGEDLDEFAVGDVVLFTTVDASAAAVSYQRTISAIDRVTRIVTFSGGAMASCNPATRTWDMTLPAIDQVVDRQRERFAFASDDGVTTDYGPSPEPYVWGGTEEEDDVPTLFSDVGLPDLSLIPSGQGSPAAVNAYHLMALALDRAVRYRGRTLLVGDSFATALSSPPSGVTATDWHLLHFAIPLSYPSSQESWRSVVTELVAKADTGGATWEMRPVLARSMPAGAGLSIGEYSFGGVLVPGTSHTVNSTSYAVFEQTLTLPLVVDGWWFLAILVRRTGGTGNLLLRDASAYGV